MMISKKQKRENHIALSEGVFSFQRLSPNLLSDLILPLLTLDDMMTLEQAFKLNRHLHKNYLKKVFYGYKVEPVTNLVISSKLEVSFMKKHRIFTSHLRIFISSNYPYKTLDTQGLKILLELCGSALESLEIRKADNASRLDYMSAALEPYLPQMRELIVSVEDFEYLMGAVDHSQINVVTSPSFFAVLNDKARNLRKFVLHSTSLGSNDLFYRILSSSADLPTDYKAMWLARVIYHNPLLEHVSLKGAPYRRALFESLATLRETLRYLSLEQCQVKHPDYRSLLLQALSVDLEELHLPEIEKSDYSFNLEVIKRCGHGLKHLDLSHSTKSQVNSACLVELANRCPNLEMLDISIGGSEPMYTDDEERNNWGVTTDEDYDYLARHCPKLRIIRLRRHEGITERAVDSLLQHCPQIQTIEILYSAIFQPFEYFANKEKELLAAGRRVELMWSCCSF